MILLKRQATLTHWLQQLFAKNAFLEILEIFRLDMGQISSNLLKKTFDSMAFVPLVRCFMTLLRHAQKSKCLTKKVTYIFRLLFFITFLDKKVTCIFSLFSSWAVTKLFVFLVFMLNAYVEWVTSENSTRQRQKSGFVPRVSAYDYLFIVDVFTCAYAYACAWAYALVKTSLERTVQASILTYNLQSTY